MQFKLQRLLWPSESQFPGSPWVTLGYTDNGGLAFLLLLMSP